jgi:class 3 adenylate cyclase
MKSVVREAAERFALSVEEIDVDSSALLQERFGAEVTVLFIDGRKAFKYQVTRKALEQILKRRSRRP